MIILFLFLSLFPLRFKIVRLKIAITFLRHHNSYTVLNYHIQYYNIHREYYIALFTVYISSTNGQRCGNIEPTNGHFDLFSSLLSCSQYTLYTVQFQFTRHSLDLLDNVLHDWLFPHHCSQLF